MDIWELIQTAGKFFVGIASIWSIVSTTLIPKLSDGLEKRVAKWRPAMRYALCFGLVGIILLWVVAEVKISNRESLVYQQKEIFLEKVRGLERDCREYFKIASAAERNNEPLNLDFQRDIRERLWKLYDAASEAGVDKYEFSKETGREVSAPLTAAGILRVAESCEKYAKRIESQNQ